MVQAHYIQVYLLLCSPVPNRPGQAPVRGLEVGDPCVKFFNTSYFQDVPLLISALVWATYYHVTFLSYVTVQDKHLERHEEGRVDRRGEVIHISYSGFLC